MSNNDFTVKPAFDNVKAEYSYYTIFGDHSALNDEGLPLTDSLSTCLAYKKITDESKEPQYYIKVGIHGKIYNPIGMFSEGRSNKFLSKIGKNEYNFTRVNKKIFDLYTNFLKTKNLAWLNNAERELV